MLPWTTYEAASLAATSDPDGFWLAAADRVTWEHPPEGARQTRPDGWTDWFPGGRLNTSFNALDRHVADGRGMQTALVWHSGGTGETRTISYEYLLTRVAGFAGGLQGLGVTRGDRVLIAMPTTIETVIAMLACARLGAIHVVVFAGYSPQELARRIDDVAPKLVIIASCCFQGRTAVPSQPALVEALDMSGHQTNGCVILQRDACPATLQAGRDHDYADLERSELADAVSLRSEDPLYILHTSGTTGRSKGVVRDHGGHAVALALSMELIYGCRPGETFFTTSDLGWVVGHSYGVYAPLLNGCTSVIVEGGVSGDDIMTLCRDFDVKCLFTTPTQLRLLRQERRHTAAQPHTLAHVFIAGEYADSTLVEWATRYFNRPVLNHWWQTETGWSITAQFCGLSDEIVASSLQGIGRPSPGFRVSIEQTRAEDVCGEVMIALPLPPGCLAGIWKSGRTEAPQASLDGSGRAYRTFDEGAFDSSGTMHMLGRSDDVIKVAGRRISAVQIENIIAADPDVNACAVVAVTDELRGHRPVAFVVHQPWLVQAPDKARLIERVSTALGRWVGLREIHFVSTLPTTTSGKILRRSLAASQISSDRGVITTAISPNTPVRRASCSG